MYNVAARYGVNVKVWDVQSVMLDVTVATSDSRGVGSKSLRRKVGDNRTLLKFSYIQTSTREAKSLRENEACLARSIPRDPAMLSIQSLRVGWRNRNLFLFL